MILSRETRALHLAERAAFVKTLRDAGPTAPTLCEGWTAQTLAAHIVVSEQHAGIPMTVAYPVWRLVSARTAGALRARLDVTGQRLMATAEARGWDWLLGRLEGGPPRPFGLRLVAELRLVEEFIHHEDVRRANGGAPRTLRPAMSEGLLDGILAISSFALFADSRRGVEAVLPDGRTYCVGDGTPAARVSGDVGEIALWLAGRGSAADVEVDGEFSEAALRV